MKKLVITLGIAFLSLSTCFMSMGYVINTSKKAENYVEKIKFCMYQKNYDEALKISILLGKFWEDNKEKLSMILHHDVLDELEESFAGIQIALENSNEQNFLLLIKIEKLLIKIKNLKDCECLSLGNLI